MGAPSTLFPLCGADVRGHFWAQAMVAVRSCRVVDVETVMDQRFP